jgi:acyl-CoA dehydrogenase
MSEPSLASSDARNISTIAVLNGDDWLINGEKFFVSGAGDPRCKLMICMVKTDATAAPDRQQSQIIVPLDTPGVEIVNPMLVFGHDDAPLGHMHIQLKDVRVPKHNVILGAGRGFEIAQARLGPGRIHHCMRAIGLAERALQLMCERGLARRAFGKPLIRLGGNLELVSRSRIEIESMRLMTLRAARAMDILPRHQARMWVHALKAMVPAMAAQIVDRAIQLHGGAGLSQWSPLWSMYVDLRVLRIADGPDEVHHLVVGRNELSKYSQGS